VDYKTHRKIITIIAIVSTLTLSYIMLFGGKSNIAIMEIRISKLLILFIIGISLPLSGAILQIITHNSLAEPYLLGISSSAFLFIIIGRIIFETTILYHNLIWSIIGSLVGILLMVSISKKKAYSPLSIVVAGIMLNLLFSSISLFLMKLLKPSMLVAIESWIMGYIGYVDIKITFISTIIVGIILIYLLANTEKLELLSIDTELAHTSGVDTRKWRIIFSLLSAILTAIPTALSGPIGFIGLVIPYIARGIGYRHFFDYLITNSIIGITTTLFAYTISNLIFYPESPPIGITLNLLLLPPILLIMFREI
jgi:iron complex transport system permease protein